LSLSPSSALVKIFPPVMSSLKVAQMTIFPPPSCHLHQRYWLAPCY
jgi:hypothetical protein